MTDGTLSQFVRDALTPTGAAVPSFEFYAAHFLVGSDLTDGDLDGNVRALALEFRTHYERGRRAHGEQAPKQEG